MSIINGTAGADTLAGTEDADSISGLAGDDIIDARGGVDTVSGGDGADALVITTLASDQTYSQLDGGLGVDTLDASAITSSLSFVFNPTTNVVTLANFDVANAEIYIGGSGRNAFDFSNATDEQVTAGFIAYGGSGSDIFTGGDFGDTFYGGAGDDRFANLSASFRGGDVAYGGDGSDRFVVSGRTMGSAAAGLIDGGAGVDLLSAGSGFVIDLARGTAVGGLSSFSLSGIENVQVSVSQGMIAHATGDGGANVLSVNPAFNDALGGATLNGAGGDDTLMGGAGGDLLTGGSGTDAVDYGLAGAGVTVSLLLQGSSQNTIGAGFDTLSGIENVSGSSFGDTLTGDASANVINGSGGDDTLFGGGAGDTLIGGGGSDVFAYAAASESTGSAPDLIADFQSGVDLIDLPGVSPTAVSVVAVGAVNFVFVDTPNGAMVIALQGQVQGSDFRLPSGLGIGYVGGAGADSLVGGLNFDALNGGAGDDTLVGGGAGDVLTGGAGADVFRLASAADSTDAAPDIITDFQTGIDKIDLTAAHPLSVNLVLTPSATFLFAPSVDGPNIQLNVTGLLSAADISTGSGIGINVIGSDAAESIVGSGALDALSGGGGNDTLVGGGHGDVLTGGADADTFRYFSSADSNSASYDIITDFQTGQDVIDLGAAGVSGVNIIQQAGASFLFAYTAQGDMQIVANGVVNGSDLSGLTSGIGLLGADGATHNLVGADFKDTISGGSLSDTIIGGAGNDVLNGRGGADVIVGGAGADVLTGGTNSDTFVFLAISDSPLNGGDTITDFQTRNDHVDISALHTAGATLNYITASGSSFIFVDQGGGGDHEALIVLQNVTTVSTSDFIW